MYICTDDYCDLSYVQDSFNGVDGTVKRVPDGVALMSQHPGQTPGTLLLGNTKKSKGVV